MNNDILEGNWKERRGQVKNWWGKLTDDDLAQIQGKRDMLVGALQKRYGYTKEKAEEEVRRRFDGFGKTGGIHAKDAEKLEHETSEGMTSTGWKNK